MSDSIDVMDAPVGAYRDAVKTFNALQEQRQAVRQELARLVAEDDELEAKLSEAGSALYGAAQAVMSVAAGPAQVVLSDEWNSYGVHRARKLAAVGSAS